jgi:phage gp36-like protein
MPYSIYATCGQHLSGATSATIAVYKSSDDSAVTLTSAACTESGSDLFTWSTSNITTQPTARTEYYYTMTPNSGSAKQGKFTLLTYSDHIAVKRLLRTATNNIRVGTPSTDVSNSQYDIQEDEMTEFIRDADSIIDARLSAHYSLPLALSSVITKRIIYDVATLLASYRVFCALYPSATVEELPAVVVKWKEDAEKMLDRICAGEVVMTGETPATGSGASAIPKYGEPSTIYPDVGCDTVDDVQSDSDVTANS